MSLTCLIASSSGPVRSRSTSSAEAPGTPLLSLAASADAEVHARVPAVQVDGLLAAAPPTLVAGGAEHALRIVRVSPVLDAAGQARDVILAAASALPPGLAGELRWRSRVPHLPPGYVQQREGRLGAWRVRGAEPEFVVLPEAQAGRAAAVDWPADTQVVDEGRFAIGLEAPADAAGGVR